MHGTRQSGLDESRKIGVELSVWEFRTGSKFGGGLPVPRSTSAKPAAADHVGHTLARPDIPSSDLTELARPDAGMLATWTLHGQRFWRSGGCLTWRMYPAIGLDIPGCPIIAIGGHPGISLTYVDVQTRRLEDIHQGVVSWGFLLIRSYYQLEYQQNNVFRNTEVHSTRVQISNNKTPRQDRFRLLPATTALPEVRRDNGALLVSCWFASSAVPYIHRSTVKTFANFLGVTKKRDSECKIGNFQHQVDVLRNCTRVLKRFANLLKRFVYQPPVILCRALGQSITISLEGIGYIGK